MPRAGFTPAIWATWTQTDACSSWDERKMSSIVPTAPTFIPAYIETLLENDPFVHQAILVGDHRPFIAALIVPDKGKIAAELHKEESALTESEIAIVLQSRIDQINLRLEQFEKIRKFVVMENDFSDKVRTTTVFQKIKIDRKAVEELHQKEITAIYPPVVGRHEG